MSQPARAVAALAAILLPAHALLALHFRDAPPARVTGGFGEDSCAACHFGNPLNEGGGALTLAGFPERFEPGEAYKLELTLDRAGLKAAGFQLAVRAADGITQAGRIELPAAEDASVAILEERGVQFAHQKTVSAPPAGETAVRWPVTWIAPETTAAVTLHASAVAGDGAESQAGDFVYTLERVATSP